MLLDQEFLAGPQDAHPDYLDMRRKLFAVVEHRLDLAFYNDLEAAAVLETDASTRKQLGSELIARFQALSL
jgi:hypothetical protein